MNHRPDYRLPSLVLTLFLIGGLGLTLEFWPKKDTKETERGYPPAATGRLENHSRQEQIRPKNEIAERFQQGVLMLHAGNHDYAVTAFRRVLELSPEMPEAHVNMGFALFGQGHYAVARDFFRSAIELRPGQVNAYWGLAVSLEALCDIPGAIGAMRSYVHLGDKDDSFQRKAQSALWEWEAADAADSGCGQT